MKNELENILQEFNLNLGFNFSEILNRPLVKPYWVFISLSHACNFNCQMCGVKKILKGKELEFALIKKTLEEIAAWKTDCVILFTGGEVFLRKDIFDIIGLAVSLGLATEVVTNGSLINNPQIAGKVIKSGLKNIAISLDGDNPRTHDYIRGVKGAYQGAVDALGYLCRQKQSWGRGPQISVWTTIMKENIEELYNMIALTKNIGIDCLVYHPVIVAQEDMQNTINQGQFWVTPEYIPVFQEQIRKIVSYQKKNGLVAFLHEPDLWLKYFQGTLNKNDWKCNSHVFIDIGPDGLVRSCGAAFGNIREMSLAQCLHSPDAQNARARMRCCQKPCLQTCWSRPEADSVVGITKRFIRQLNGSNEPAGAKKKTMDEGIKALTQYENLIAQEAGKNGK